METLKPLLLLTGLAALLRLPTLTIESLWYDETFTAWLAGLPVGNLVSATMGDVHPPTWYLIEWAAVQVLGRSEFSLRLVSALAGIGLVWAVSRLAATLDFPRETQTAAALVAAVAPFAVYYSQEARAYSLIYLLTTLATIGLIERRWWLLILSATAALYLNNLTVFYIGALGWLALYRYRLDWKPLASLAIVGVLWLPWLVWGLLPQMADVTDGFWVRPPTIGTPVFILISWLFSEKALLLVMVTTPLLTIALLTGSAKIDAARRWQLLGLLLIPLGLAVIASVLITPVLVGRVIGSSAVALWLLIAPALQLAPPKMAVSPFWAGLQQYALPVLVGLVLIAFYPIYWGTDRIGRYPWDYGLDPLLEELSPADGLFHAILATYIVLNYYLPETDQVVWKQANDLSQSLTNETIWAMDMQQARFEDVACNHRRWYLAFYENPTTSDTERAEIARLVETYHGQQLTTILKNQLVNARVFRLDNVCRLEASR